MHLQKWDIPAKSGNCAEVSHFPDSEIRQFPDIDASGEVRYTATVAHRMRFTFRGEIVSRQMRTSLLPKVRSDQIMLNKDIGIVGKQYGYYTYGKNNTPIFNPIGKLPDLQEVLVGLENQHITLKLAQKFLGETNVAYLDYGNIYDGSGVKELTAIGFDARKGYVDAYLEALAILVRYRRSQPTLAYENLGWFQRSEVNPDTGQRELHLLFRCHKLLGTTRKARYIGPYDIEPHGDYDVWRQMVINDIVPYPALQLVLIAALSSVVIGLLALRREISRPIVHTVLPSGRGKTTVALACASTAGSPAHAPMPRIDEDGRIVRRHSLLGSWSSTDNALLSTNAGNFGTVLVLNELGKSLSKNLDAVVFALADGSDKKRLTTTLQPRVSDAYAMTVISNGEMGLLEKCNTRLEGLAIRVLEIDKELTKNADHANRITDVCKENYGFAAPRLAQYIIDLGGYQPVSDRYDELRRELRSSFTAATPSKERFIEIFAAPFMLTAELASKALKIPFDTDGLLKFLVDHEKENGANRATSDKSYRELLEEFEINLDKFIVGKANTLKKPPANPYASTPHHQVWGRITNMSKVHTDGRVIVREYEVFPSVVDQILKKYGHTNRSTCVKAWKEMDVIETEGGTHYMRKRKIVNDDSGHTDRVFVFREFEDLTPSGGATPPEDPPKSDFRENSQMDVFLQVDDDDELGGDLSA